MLTSNIWQAALALSLEYQESGCSRTKVNCSFRREQPDSWYPRDRASAACQIFDVSNKPPFSTSHCGRIKIIVK